MSIQHAMNIGPAKINALFGRLADTTDGAAKRREAVLAELTAEISLVADLEEKHLLPLLAKHEETKAVVAAAREDNAAILRQLGELSRVPKVGDAFMQGVDSLRKAFQRSVRDDRKELLPAVKTVLSREEVDAVADKMRSGAADAEQARRDETVHAKDDAKAAREGARPEAKTVQAKDDAKGAREESRPEAKAVKARDDAKGAREESRPEAKAVQAKDEAKAAAGRTRKAKAVQAADRTREASEKASGEATRKTAATIREAGEALGEATREGAGRMVDDMRRVTTTIGDATGIYRDAATGTSGDLQAVVSASGVAARAAADLRRHWNEHLTAALQDGIALSQRLMRCKTGIEVAEAQRDYAKAATHAWLASQVKILEVTQRASAEALPTLQARLGENPGQRDRTARSAR